MVKLMRASEAHKIAAEENEDEIMRDIMSKISNNANKGEFELQVREFGFGNIYGGDPSPKQQRVLDRLKELGYKVRMKVVSSQFVDIYLEITW